MNMTNQLEIGIDLRDRSLLAFQLSDEVLQLEFGYKKSSHRIRCIYPRYVQLAGFIGADVERAYLKDRHIRLHLEELRFIVDAAMSHLGSTKEPDRDVFVPSYKCLCVESHHDAEFLIVVADEIIVDLLTEDLI